MKAGPVEVVESRGVRIPIYSSPAFGKASYLISYYAGGKRKRERVGTLREARSQAKAKIGELTSGTAHVSTFTPRQIATVVDAVDVLKGVGVSLSQVAREYVEAFKILRRQPLIAEAAKHYAAYLERQRVMHAVKFPAAVDTSRESQAQTLKRGSTPSELPAARETNTAPRSAPCSRSLAPADTFPVMNARKPS